MIVVDVNLRIYAVNEDSLLHSRAKQRLEALLGEQATVGFSWLVLLAFLRLTTKRGFFQNPLRSEEALDLVERWIERPGAVVIQAGPGHARILRDILLPLGMGGNLTSDAHLAALAMEHNAELCSADGDFARFAGLRWRNPLE